jgi:hypothetical protein
MLETIMSCLTRRPVSFSGGEILGASLCSETPGSLCSAAAAACAQVGVYCRQVATQSVQMWLAGS